MNLASRGGMCAKKKTPHKDPTPQNRRENRGAEEGMMRRALLALCAAADNAKKNFLSEKDKSRTNIDN